MKIPTIGQKVRFNKRVEGDAGMFVPIGATGVIDGIEGTVESPDIRVLLDKPFDKDGCDGCCAFYHDCDPPFEPSPLAAFWQHCEIIG